MADAIEIKHPKLILCEGMDAKWFIIWLLEHFSIPDVQVIDYGGIDDLNQYLSQLTKVKGYNNVQSIAIMRDAETDYKAALQSVCSSISKIGLVAPDAPFCLSDSKPRVGFVIFPCIDGQCGTLEDFCLELCILPHLDKVKEFLSDIEKITGKLARPHKNQLHSLFSISNDFVGMKIGEATKANAFDWEYKSVLKIKEFIEQMG